LVGATLGFLRFNFHPARIFMGDSGSMLLGLVLGGATISGVSNSPVGLSPSNAEVFLAYFPLLIPMLVLAIPCRASECLAAGRGMRESVRLGPMSNRWGRWSLAARTRPLDRVNILCI
jgi:hypothetical protein